MPVPGDPSAQMRRAGQWVPYTPPFNMSGQPAISLPLHWNDAGLPIGVQLVAAYGREDVLVRVAAQLEAAHPWADRPARRSDAVGPIGRRGTLGAARSSRRRRSATGRS